MTHCSRILATTKARETIPERVPVNDVVLETKVLVSRPGAAEGEEKWRVKAHGERTEREPITGVWGAEPPAGSRAESLGAKPPRS